MKHQMRVWIHCRVVSQYGEKCLLGFQEKILKDFAVKMNLKIEGITNRFPIMSMGEMHFLKHFLEDIL